MSLAELTVDHFRCLERVQLELHPGHNLIWGNNAAGKTSVLEAIFLLGRGRSFRTRNSERLIRQGKEQLVVFGRTAGTSPTAIGIQVSRHDGTTAKVDGAFVQSLAALAAAFPVQVIEPGIHRLVEEGGHRRRRWLDWGVFHVEPSFADTWATYTRAVKQRNAALRGQQSIAAAWNPELTRLGEAIADSRQRFLERLLPYWQRMVSSLAGIDVELHHSRGWTQGLTLAEAVTAAENRDLARGMTHAGPHRADVLIRLNGKPARDVLSRGQQKLVAIAMTLSQLQLLREATGISPTLLLDDPAAELDKARLECFTAQVAALDCQLVVTSLTADLDPLGVPARVFHVERGGVEPV